MMTRQNLKGGANMAKYKLYSSEKVHDLREMIERSSTRHPNKTAFLQKVEQDNESA